MTTTMMPTNQRVKLAEIKTHSRNYNRHPAKQIERIAMSLRKFGQVRSIVVWQNTILAGHGVVEAAKALGWQSIVADVLPDEYPEHLALAYVAADNELSRLSDPDQAALAAILEESKAADAELLQAIGYNDQKFQALLDEIKASALNTNVLTSKSQISKSSRLYNAGDGHDIEPFKLAYRVEAAWRANSGKAIDLFSGHGQLASWYRRRFSTVVTIDKAYAQGDVDYSMLAIKFIKLHLSQHLDFDFVDFDDEGCPSHEIKEFFAEIQGKVNKPFVLALTDGTGLAMKCRGRGDMSKLYLIDGESMRQFTLDDYNRFDEIVLQFVKTVSERFGFTATVISNYRGRNGNVVFQTWQIAPAHNMK